MYQGNVILCNLQKDVIINYATATMENGNYIFVIKSKNAFNDFNFYAFFANKLVSVVFRIFFKV